MAATPLHPARTRDPRLRFTAALYLTGKLCLLTGLGCGPASQTSDLEPSDPAAMHPLEQRLLEHWQAPSLDPALSELCRLLLAARGDAPPIPANLDAWAAHAGHLGPVPRIQYRVVPEDVPLEAWSEPPTWGTDAWGMAVAHDAPTTLVLAHAPRTVTMTGFRRQGPVDATLPIRGALAPGLHAPSIWLSGPGSTPVTSIPVQTTRGPKGLTFAADFRCAAAGRWWVELLAEDERGPHVLFNTAVTCGDPVVPTPLPPWSSAPQTHETAPQVEAGLVRAIQRTRHEAGLPPLRIDTAVGRVARQHSISMAREGVLAHVDAAGRDLGQRLHRAGLALAEVRENIATGPDAEAIHAALMRSPAHRQNILAPHVTHVGIGVSAGTTAAGSRWWVTENFTRPASPDYPDAWSPRPSSRR